jgi:hypothetical protein
MNDVPPEKGKTSEPNSIGVNDMERKEYSAGMVKLSFWFPEFRKVINLLNAGKTMKEIKEINNNENLFGTPTQARATQIYNTVLSRINGLDKAFYTLFENGDIAMQKLITLIAIMKSDSLFFDFIYEVYREKQITGANEFDDSDIRVFFKNKQLQNDKVAGWKDYTLKKLRICYKTMLMEAGVTDRSAGARKILRPLLDKELEDCLRANGMELYIKALTGVR